MIEIWKTLPEYEGIYEVSNKGRVKSLKRDIVFKDGRVKKVNESIMIPYLSNRGYYNLSLSKNGKSKKKDIHQLVSICFLGHIPSGYKKVVNHINFNRLDNNVSNLEIVTPRENGNQFHLKSFSKHVGVCKGKGRTKFRASIRINGLNYHLGSFKCEIQASKAYKQALYDYNNDKLLPKKHKYTSKYKGVSFHKQTGKWQATFLRDKKYLGLFETELEAKNKLEMHKKYIGIIIILADIITNTL